MFNSKNGAARIAVVAISALMILSACNAATAPTAVPATATPTPTATPTKTAAATPTDFPTPEITVAPSASAAASASAEPSASADASAPSLAASCTGKPENQQFFVDTAKLMKFDLYCAALPSKWWLSAGSYTQPKGGTVSITYKRNGGGILEVSEGAFCSASCDTNVGTLGSANFGSLSGSLDLFSASPNVYVIYVNPGTATAYTIKGTGVSQAEFVAAAATMTKVPKS